MKYVSLILLPLLLLPSYPLQAQNDFVIDLSLLIPEARVFYLGDINPTGAANARNYFQLRMENNSGIDRQARINFRVVSNSQEIVTARSNYFTLFADPGQYLFTNNQLNLGSAFIKEPTNRVKISDYRIDLDVIDNLTYQVGSTGKLPAGIYQFLVELEFNPLDPAAPADVSDQYQEDNTLIISNPTTIELIFPGSPVNSGDLTRLSTTLPYFVWQSDAGLFNLYVYRKYESESIDDVLSRDPILFLEKYPNQVFQYPSSTEPLFFMTKGGTYPARSVGPVRLIEPGNIYYWFVEARIQTASGEVLLPSDVYQFEVVDRGSGTPDSDLILSYLRQILRERYDEYLQELQGYSPSGNIVLNGNSVDVEALAELLQKLMSGKVTIENVLIEK
ncbi:MAG: hypothetical protein EH225_01915 [Calditrichaeota bacterium]|nr:hypothetical protein [Calditrichota bacterium]RQW07440.1 MAG: hypothetical protein EH225_01915 [Calditrichota bacterium]